MRRTGEEEQKERAGDGVSILDLAAAHTAKIHAAHGEPIKGVVGTGNFKRKVVSDSLAVHPDQVEELRALNKKLGVEAEVLPNGQVVFDNSNQMRKYARARGWRHYGY